MGVMTGLQRFLGKRVPYQRRLLIRIPARLGDVSASAFVASRAQVNLTTTGAAIMTLLGIAEDLALLSQKLR